MYFVLNLTPDIHVGCFPPNLLRVSAATRMPVVCCSQQWCGVLVRLLGGKATVEAVDQWTLSQAFGVLHGGISAFVAESLASLGAVIASGLQRVAGVELSISHLKPAPIGLEIEVKATPINIGHRLHVWEVKFTSTSSVSNGQAHYNSSNIVEPSLIAVSKLTVTVLPSKRVTKSHDVETIPSKL